MFDFELTLEIRYLLNYDIESFKYVPDIVDGVGGQFHCTLELVENLTVVGRKTLTVWPWQFRASSFHFHQTQSHSDLFVFAPLEQHRLQA